MEKITIKDVKKHLTIKSRFKVIGKHWNSIAKSFFQKYKNGWKKLVEKVLPNEEQIEIEKQNQISKKEDKIDVKRNELKQFIGQMEQDDEYRIGVKNCYLKEVKVKLKKLDRKRMQVSKKGLGVFALTKLTLSNMKNNIKNKWANHKEERNEVKHQKEIEDLKEALRLNHERMVQLQNEEKEILNQYPEIRDEEITSTMTRIKTDNEEEVTEITTKTRILSDVTSISKPKPEKENEIKKSNNYKKALAAIAVVTGIAIGTANIANNINKNSSVSPDLSVTNPNQVEYNIDTTEKKTTETKLKLGDYVNINNGSIIYSTPELNGNHGIIGTNGYTDDTLFQINAITYVDENNNEKSFNMVQQSDLTKNKIREEHQKYIQSNPNVKVKNFHITPCDELGIPEARTEKETDLGGWTNNDKANIQTVDKQTVTMNAYKSLGGKVL